MEGLLSIVLPAYNEEKMICKAATTVADILKKHEISYEILFVNDGSKDDTWNEINKAKQNDDRVRGIRFSRNFGKEAAIYAGLDTAKGNAVVVMDCDLQHPPEKIVEMYRLWQQGFEVVEGVKTDRGKESWLHKKFAKLFYDVISNATGIDMQNASDFKLLDQKVVKELCTMPERNTFFRALSAWVGYKRGTVKFEVQERTEGTTKWSFKSLFQYALNNITAFTAIPLQLVTISGIVIFLLAILLGVQTIIRYISGTAVEGFTTVILLLLFIGSIIMISLGIIGYYLSKIYDEIKHRPKFIVAEEI